MASPSEKAPKARGGDGAAARPCENCAAREDVFEGFGGVWLCLDCSNTRMAVTERSLPKAELAGRRLVATRASAVSPRSVAFAWEGRIPLGAVTLLSGRQGLGKSTLSCSLAADLTLGKLPGDLHGTPVDVAIVSYEDHAETTIVPRLIAAGADRHRIHLLEVNDEGIADLVSLPTDLTRIADYVKALAVRALIIDPLVAGLDRQVDAHRDQDVRGVVAPMAQLAEQADLAILATIHLRKGGSAEALDRVSGSIGFTAAARSVLAFGADSEDEDGVGRILAHAKSNVGPLAPSLAYRVEGASVDESISTSKLVLLGESEVEAHDLLSPAAPIDRTDTELAAEWLSDELADGEWHPSRTVKDRANQPERTVQRAAKLLGVEIEKQGFPATTHWRLADAPASVAPLENHEPGATIETRMGTRFSGVTGSGRAKNANLGATRATGTPEDAVLDPHRAAEIAAAVDGEWTDPAQPLPANAIVLDFTRQGAKLGVSPLDEEAL